MRVMDACPSTAKSVCVFVSVCVYALWHGCQLFHQAQRWHIPDASCSGVSLVNLPTSPSSKHSALSSDSTYLFVKNKCFFFTDLLILYYFFKNCMSPSEWIQKPKLNKYFHPVSLIKTVGSTREWLIIVCQLNTQCNMTQSIIWLSIFIFLPY